MLLVTRDDFNFSLYQYDPSLIPAIVATGLFAVGGVVHIILVMKLRATYFIPFVIGCFMEALGYGGRIWSHYDPNGLPGYIIQSLLILISPALFAASIYMVLGRIIALTDGERYALIRLKWLTKLFVAGDCVSFFVQCIGGGIQAAGTLDLLHMGEKIIVAGLFAQIASFGFFIVVAIVFNVRVNAAEKRSSSSCATPWRRHLYVLYLTSVLILVRSIFRVVEYLMGNSGFILMHEYMLYIFDTILMLLVVATFMWTHPGRILAKKGKDNVEFNLLETQ